MKESLDRRRMKNNIMSIPKEEIDFSCSRSSGPGGQNINKRDTKVTLSWNVDKSRILDEEQKERVKRKLAKYITKEGNIVLYVQDSRSQEENKEAAMKKLNEMISKALEKKKKRIPTKPPKRAIEQRLEEKRRQSQKKALRKPIRF